MERLKTEWRCLERMKFEEWNPDIGYAPLDCKQKIPTSPRNAAAKKADEEEEEKQMEPNQIIQQKKFIGDIILNHISFFLCVFCFFVVCVCVFFLA